MKFNYSYEYDKNGKKYSKPKSIKVEKIYRESDNSITVETKYYKNREYRDYLDYVKTWGVEIDTSNDALLKREVKNTGCMKTFTNHIHNHIYMPMKEKLPTVSELRELLK